MIGRTNTGSGGGGLNFKIVGGTTEQNNPSENTIWVNTPVKITSSIFDVAEPKNPNEGMVWIFTGTSSVVAFSATKKNPVMVYPLTCKQYVGGVWVDRITKTYQAGTWIEWWNGQLYTPGNEWETFTGGWTTKGMKSQSSSSAGAKAPTITRSSDYIRAEQTEAYAGLFHISKPIDLSKYSKIVVEGDFNCAGSSTNNLLLGVYESPLPSYYSSDAVAKKAGTLGTSKKMELDISNISGKYIVGIGMTAKGTYAKITSAYMV